LPEDENRRKAEKLLSIYAVVYDISVWSSRNEQFINLIIDKHGYKKPKKSSEVRRNHESV
jgi:hypothetical protein